MPDDTDTNGREALLATAFSEDGAIGQGRRRTSTSSLSEGFNREGSSSRWDQTGTTEEGARDNNLDDDDDDDGSEHELLLNSHQQTNHLPPSARRGHPSASMEMVDITTDDDSTKVPVVRFDEDVEQENSPYPEVRAAVRNYDEDLPCNTVRAWTIGMSLIFLGASMNTVFSLRSPSISLGSLIAQIIAWPIGHGWARVMPTKQFNTFGLRWSLNPGPFNIKEHAIIVVMASVSFSVAYATDIILAQLVFYKQDFGLAFQLLLTISTQSLGYGIAGMMRRYLGKLQDSPICPTKCADLDSVPGRHDLACQPRQRDLDERHVREEREERCQGVWWLHASLSVVRDHHASVCNLLLHPGLFGPVSQLVRLCHLDLPQEPRHQPAVWNDDRPVVDTHHVRLDTNLGLHWVAPCSTLVRWHG